MNKRFCRALALLMAAVLWIRALNHMELTVTRYRIPTEKLSEDFRIALLSDLHSQEFGPGNSSLIREIRAYEPDLILMCGDMVSRHDTQLDVVLSLCRELAGIADVYYLYGNHEGVLQYDPTGPRVPLDRYLTEEGAEVLYGGLYHIPTRGGEIILYAKSIHAEEYRQSPSRQAEVEEFLAQEGFLLAMSHYPDLFYDALADKEFDLAVAGHYHGGQIIIPGLGGLFHLETGFFPAYYGGTYELEHGTLIVSRGLGNDICIPRINNDPELIFLDITAK